MSRLTLPLIIAIFSFITGCHSSKVTVPPGTKTTGKKILIGNFYINSTQKNKNAEKKDTVCVCVGQAIQEAFVPYLQEAGFIVIKAPIEPKIDLYRSIAIADSVGVDYLLTGKGLIDITNSASYVDELTANIIDIKTQAVLVSSTFTGIVVRPAKAVSHIGKKMVKQLH